MIYIYIYCLDELLEPQNSGHWPLAIETGHVDATLKQLSSGLLTLIVSTGGSCARRWKRLFD